MASFSSRCFLFLAAALTFSRVAVAQYAFEIPIPKITDFNAANNVVQYSNFNFVWLVNTTYQPTVTGEKLLDSQNHISLWLTSFDGNGFTRCLNPSVDSTNGGSWSFNVSLTDDEIDSHNGKFVLRLKPTVGSISSTYPITERECPSRGFLIKKAASTATTTTTTTASATASATSTSTSTPATSATASPASADDGSGLGTGAIVGIVVGVVAGVLFLAVIAYILYRRRGRKSQAQPPQPDQNTAYYPNTGEYASPAGYYKGPDAQQYQYQNVPQGPAELGGSEEARSELPANHIPKALVEAPS